MSDNTEQHPVAERVNVITDMDDDLVAMAHQAAEREKAMPFKEALKIFWPGAMWSMCLSLALVMEGYDVGLVSISDRMRIMLTRSSKRSSGIQPG
jgi:hypothetical protein